MSFLLKKPTNVYFFIRLYECKIHKCQCVCNVFVFLTVKEYALKALDLDFIAEMSVLLGV